MRHLIVYFIFLLSSGYGQITQVKSGTSENLLDIFVVDGEAIISGSHNYLAKCSGGCESIEKLPCPVSQNYFNRLWRIDKDTMFLLSYTGSNTLLHKSTDGGQNWTQKLNENGTFLNRQIAFFNSMEGLMSRSMNLYSTTNSGTSWTHMPNNLSTGIDVIKTYNDSIVAIGGVGFPNATGDFFLSKDKGNTWPYAWGFGKGVADFHFLNGDTIISISDGGEFSVTYNGGSNWSLPFAVNAIKTSYGVLFKNAKEGYMVGTNEEGIGLIIKTYDMGKTWLTYNTEVKTVLLRMAFLNDSTALITGTDGVLLKFNPTKAVFTEVNEEVENDAIINVFPNPVQDEQKLEFTANKVSSLTVDLYDIMGRKIKNVYSGKTGIGKTVINHDVSNLAHSLYIYHIKIDDQVTSRKFIRQ